MATIKSFTSLEQSRKLAGILPLESADMYYPWDIDSGAFLNIPIVKDDSYYVQGSIDCWSLAALLKIIGHYTLQTASKDKKVFIVSEENYPICSDNYSEPVDACVAMIEKLNQLNLL